MRFKLTFLVLLTMTVTLGAVAAPVAAQDATNETNETETGPSIEVNPVEVSNEETETYQQEIDNTTRLVDSRYSDERAGFVMTFESDASTRITFTEAVQFKEGAGSGRIYVQRIPEGTSEVFVAVERRNGQAAVTMTTRESINQNRYSYVSTGRGGSSLPTTSLGWGVSIGILTMALGMGIAVRRKRNVDHAKVESGWKD